MNKIHLSLLAAVSCVATSAAHAENWEKLHDGQVRDHAGSEVLGTHRVYLDTDSLVREGERIRYRIRIVATVFGSEQDTEIQRVSNCATNRFHRISITDRKTGRSAPPQAQEWREAVPPFNNKIQTRVCG